MYIEGNSDISAQMERNLTMLRKVDPSQRTKCAGEKGQKAGAQEYYQDGKKIGSLDILYGETIKRPDTMTGWKEPVRHFFCDACNIF